jgi:UDP-N-acetyl-D-mannosaminuronic acid dehydrogenase
MGIDVTRLIEIANKHPRVNILKPGPGVGGHCIPIDPWFLVGDFPHLTNVIAACRKTNDLMPSYIAERILNISKEEDILLNRIGVYGLTYKADVADFRESPSFEVIKEFSALVDTKLVSYDPFVENNSEQRSFKDFIDSIDLLVILVSHKHIKERLHQIEGKLIFDVVNIVNQGNVIKL